MAVDFDRLTKLFKKISVAEKKDRRNLFENVDRILNAAYLETTKEESLKTVQFVLNFKGMDMNSKASIVSSFLINRNHENISYIYRNINEQQQPDFIVSLENYINLMFENLFYINHYAKIKDPLEIEILNKIMENKKNQGVYYYKWVAMLEMKYPDSEILKHIDLDIHNYLIKSALPSEKLDQISFHLCSRFSEIRVDKDNKIMDKQESKLAHLLFNKIMEDIVKHSEYYKQYHPGIIFVYNQLVNLKKQNFLSQDIFKGEYENIDRSSEKIISMGYLKDHCLNKITERITDRNHKEFFIIAMEKELLNNNLLSTKGISKNIQRL